jgi:DNA polymerase-3 subunit beta
VLLSTDQSRLKLAATNLEIAISTWVGAEVQEEGAITVPARLLSEFVGSLPHETLSIGTDAQGSAVEVKCARVEAKINGSDPQEFPPIPSVTEGISTKIEAASLRAAIHQVVFSAAVDDSRPVLTGVNIELNGSELRLAAADGFRLSVHTSNLLSSVSEPTTIIAPARTLLELERLLDQQDGQVDVIVNPQRSQIMFRTKDVELVSQLIQGTFPPYRQLIPESHTTRIIVGLQDLARATRTAAIFARDGSGIIRLQASPGKDGESAKLVVSSHAEEVGENTGDIEAVVEGDEAKIAFNSKYLSDALSVIGDEKVAVEISAPSNPGVIRPVGSGQYVHVVMPMFVQW